MVLPRPSNTGIMISAALVGLLGLGACVFIRFAPKSLSLAAAIEMQEEVTAEEPTSLAIELSAKECAIELQKIEQRLLPLFNAYRSSGKLPKDGHQWLAKNARRAAELSRVIQKDDHFKPKYKRKALLIALSVTFQIALIDRNQEPIFSVVSNEIIGCCESDIDVTNAVGLQLVIGNNLAQPDHARLVRELEQFSTKYGSVQAGVNVYAMVSRELSFHGHQRLAQKILRLGLRKYNGRHVRQLVDLLEKEEVR